MRGEPGRDEDAGPRSPSFVKQISSAWLDVVFLWWKIPPGCFESGITVSDTKHDGTLSGKTGLLPPGFPSLALVPSANLPL